MAKYRLTAEINTKAVDIDHLVDTEDPVKTAAYLEYDCDDLPITELKNIKLERLPD
jgi:hypothetical protein